MISPCAVLSVALTAVSHQPRRSTRLEPWKHPESWRENLDGGEEGGGEDLVTGLPAKAVAQRQGIPLWIQFQCRLQYNHCRRD